MFQSKQFHLGVTLIPALTVLVGVGGAHASAVYIPNASFESPVYRVAPYATANIDDWQKAPVPVWWPNPAEYWATLAGVFYNLPGDTQIDNVDGEQAAFLFSVPGVELYQDLAATYMVGQSYRLTAKYQGGGQGMTIGEPLEFRLFYRDDDGRRITIDAAEVLNATDESQPHAKHLADAELVIPAVAADAPWAGRNIGVQMVSTVSSVAPVPGYWRIDDIQLTSVPEPAAAMLLLAGLALFKSRRSRKQARI